MGQNEINEAQIRAHYALLRHAGHHSVVHCQDVAEARMVAREVVSDESGLLAFARRFNGRGNIFIGRNPRLDASGKTLSAITGFSLDIDPEREKGTAATPEQRRSALAVARKILAVAPGGALLDSGNGYQVFYTWEPVKGTEEDYEAFARKAARWTDSLRGLAEGSGCKLDSIHDNERLVKLAGTLSVKGTPDQWRMAAFVPPMPPASGGLAVYRRISASGEPVPAGAVDSEAPAPRNFEDNVVVAARALSQLGAHRGTDYHEWLRVGMALRGLGDAGLALWDNWSKRRGGYETGACAAKWQTFEPAETGEGVTLGTLVVWAREDAQLAGGGANTGGSHSPGNEPDAGRAILDVREYLQALPARASGEAAAIELPTGIAELDAFGPLLVRGHIFTVGAYTNVGKTTLASTVSAHLAKLGKRVLFFSTENTAEEVMDRMVLALSGGWKGDRLAAAKAALAGLDIHVSDGFAPDAAAVEKTVVAVKPDVLVFDYLQHVGTSTDLRVQEIDRFVKQLHDVARRHKVAVLATAQLSRASTQEELALRHLRECGTIENESRAVLLMKRLNPNPAAEVYPIAAMLAKNKGKMGAVQLIVNAPIGRVESMIQGGN